MTIMWRSISNCVTNFGLKKSSATPSPSAGFQEVSDDETCSNASTEEGLECPICWESFNIVENVPYVLWCGHTLCKNCVLGLQPAALKFSTQQVQIPFFVSCPWCHLLTFRLVCRGQLRFPSKNFFVLWMVESRNGDRVKSPSSACVDNQLVWSPRCTSVIGSGSSNVGHRRTRLGRSRSEASDHGNIDDGISLDSPRLSLHKSLDFFIHFTAKFPLVIVLLLIVIFVLPSSAAILMLYLVITVLFALPSFLVLYFAYPALIWLIREIAT